MRFRRNWRRILLGLLFAAVLLATVGFPYVLAVLVTRAGTRPMDRAQTTSPADFGLDFEEVTFSARDGVRLDGWFLGGGSKQAVVALGHGLFRSRREVLDRAVFFRELGYDVLLFDFRRHGESGGARTTLGYQERLDFEGAVDFLRSRAPEAPVILYGVSMGAAAALLAARETLEVAAVIVDSPFLSIEHTIVHHVKLVLGLPRFPFASTLLFFLERRGGFDRDDFDLEQAASDLGPKPLLVIAGEDDVRMPPELQRRVYEASKSPESDFVTIEDADHGAAYRVAPQEYRRAVTRFLENAMEGREPK